MKVILLKNVSKIGQQYDVKDVSDGFALNFLLPRGLAKKATKEEILKVEQEKKQKKETQAKHIEELKGKLKSIKDEPIKIFGKANEKGHLFKGISKEDLGESISKSTGVSLETESILLDKPIKEIGEQEVEIKVGEGSVKIKFKIEAE